MPLDLHKAFYWYGWKTREAAITQHVGNLYKAFYLYGWKTLETAITQHVGSQTNAVKAELKLVVAKKIQH
jgi:hypothetical protein